MGCLHSVPRHLNDTEVKGLIKREIELNNSDNLCSIIREYSDFNIDEVFLTSNDLKFTPLGYALFLGKVDCFKTIYTMLGGHIQNMEDVFNARGYRAIDLICIQGSVPMLEIYLPVYISLYLDYPRCDTSEIHRTLSLASKVSEDVVESFKNTPIQHACINGNIQIIKYIQSFFKKKQIPDIFCINHQDEITGENCPLITCRIGNFKMMKYLNEICEGNFHVMNKNDENALLILAIASTKTENYDYFHCFDYLLNVVKIDPVPKNDEVVLVLNEFKLLQLYFLALEPYGICPSKEKLERANQIKQYESDYGTSARSDVLIFAEKRNSHNSALSSIQNEPPDSVFGSADHEFLR